MTHHEDRHERRITERGVIVAGHERLLQGTSRRLAIARLEAQQVDLMEEPGRIEQPRGRTKRAEIEHLQAPAVVQHVARAEVPMRLAAGQISVSPAWQPLVEPALDAPGQPG